MSDHDDGYVGAATLSVAGRRLAVDVRLAGYFQPVDGRYHWYGRISADAELAAVLGTRRTPAVLRTPHGEAAGQVGDADLWGRYRVSGLSRPPFPVPTSVDDMPPQQPPAAPEGAGTASRPLAARPVGAPGGQQPPQRGGREE